MSCILLFKWCLFYLFNNIISEDTSSSQESSDEKDVSSSESEESTSTNEDQSSQANETTESEQEPAKPKEPTSETPSEESSKASSEESSEASSKTPEAPSETTADAPATEQSTQKPSTTLSPEVIAKKKKMLRYVSEEVVSSEKTYVDQLKTFKKV